MLINFFEAVIIFLLTHKQNIYQKQTLVVTIYNSDSICESSHSVINLEDQILTEKHRNICIAKAYSIHSKTDVKA